MTRARKRRRGFYAQYARAKGMSLNAAYRKFNADKRPCAREKDECDASPPWSMDELREMDRAFCAAMEREIARASERPRGLATSSEEAMTTRHAPRPSVRASRPARRSPRRARSASRPRRRAAAGKRDRCC
jgi:monomeric isocitrate dehydrogenase